MRIAITGHRPKKLPSYGYDLSCQKWQKMIHKLYEILVRERATEVITGMALGIDQAFALAALFGKDAGFRWALTCAIPCRNHSVKWPDSSKKLYGEILQKADSIILVTDKDYTPQLMQDRNIWMIEHADLLLAVWDGSSGGTKNCIEAALDAGLPIIKINPETLQETVITHI